LRAKRLPLYPEGEASVSADAHDSRCSMPAAGPNLEATVGQQDDIAPA
jgi:hypothetical protein